MEITITIPDDQLCKLLKNIKIVNLVKGVTKNLNSSVTETPENDNDHPPSYTVKCKHCGTEFSPKRCTQIFCCSKCRQDFNDAVRYKQNTKSDKQEPEPVKQKTITKTCFVCGKEFQAEDGRQRKCPDCKNVPKKPVKKQLDEIVCTTCGQKFTPGRKNQRFCSSECRTAYIAWSRGSQTDSLTSYLAAHGFKGGFGIKKCAHCGKDFVATTVDQKYCSKECKVAHRQVRLDAAAGLKASGKSTSEMTGKKICLVCKMPFEPFDASQRFCHKCISSFGEDKCEQIIRDEQLEKDQKKKEQKRVLENQYKVCPRCGASFHDPYNSKFFCDKCTSRAQKVPKIKPLEDDPSLNGVTI